VRFEYIQLLSLLESKDIRVEYYHTGYLKSIMRGTLTIKDYTIERLFDIEEPERNQTSDPTFPLKIEEMQLHHSSLNDKHNRNEILKEILKDLNFKSTGSKEQEEAFKFIGKHISKRVNAFIQTHDMTELPRHIILGKRQKD